MRNKQSKIKGIRRPFKRSLYVEIILLVVIISSIVVPLIAMMTKIDGKAIDTVFSDQSFLSATCNSLLTTTISTILSIAIAYALAWSLSRTNIKLKAIFSIVLVLPMLMPTISHGMGLVILFGNNGIITRLFGMTSHLFGYNGIILGSVIYSFPVAFLMFMDIFKYEDYTPYEAAQVFGISKPRQFLNITMPYMRKPLISIVFTVFTMIITDYGINLAVGGKVDTLPVMLYENTVGQLNYSSGAVIGIILLIPALLAFLLDVFNKDKGNLSYAKKDFAIKKSIVKNIIAYTICTLASIMVLLVIISFSVQAFASSYPSNMSFSFKHVLTTVNKSGIEYLTNSILMSMFTALFGMALCFLVAYCSARLKTKMSRVLHIFSMLSLAIPGLVLGLSYVIVFKTSFLYGTIAMLILVNTVHFFASPYLMMYNALGKINGNLENVGQVLNISHCRIIKDVIIPQSKSTLLEAFSYFFVNSMITISAVSFLATNKNKPLSLMINQFEAFNMLECAAVVALMILIVNILMKVIIFLIKRKVNKNVNKKTI